MQGIFLGFVVYTKNILSPKNMYCTVIKADVYRKYMVQYNHKVRQDAYKSSQEVGFNSDWKEKEKLCGTPEI